MTAAAGPPHAALPSFRERWARPWPGVQGLAELRACRCAPRRQSFEARGAPPAAGTSEILRAQFPNGGEPLMAISSLAPCARMAPLVPPGPAVLDLPCHVR